jgi:hypothetical protein
MNNLHTSYNNTILLHQTIQNDNRLPQNCTLRGSGRVRRSERQTHFITIDFEHTQSDQVGVIMISVPNGMNDFEMMCCINSHNGYFMEITVNTMDDVYDVIHMCQYILQFQPNNIHLDYVRVPNNYLHYWWIPNYLREVNLNPPNTQNQID